MPETDIVPHNNEAVALTTLDTLFPPILEPLRDKLGPEFRLLEDESLPGVRVELARGEHNGKPYFEVEVQLTTPTEEGVNTAVSLLALPPTPAGYHLEQDSRFQGPIYRAINGDPDEVREEIVATLNASHEVRATYLCGYIPTPWKGPDAHRLFTRFHLWGIEGSPGQPNRVMAERYYNHYPQPSETEKPKDIADRITIDIADYARATATDLMGIMTTDYRLTEFLEDIVPGLIKRLPSVRNWLNRTKEKIAAKEAQIGKKIDVMRFWNAAGHVGGRLLSFEPEYNPSRVGFMNACEKQNQFGGHPGLAVCARILDEIPATIGGFRENSVSVKKGGKGGRLTRLLSQPAGTLFINRSNHLEEPGFVYQQPNISLVEVRSTWQNILSYTPGESVRDLVHAAKQIPDRLFVLADLERLSEALSDKPPVKVAVYSDLEMYPYDKAIFNRMWSVVALHCAMNMTAKEAYDLIGSRFDLGVDEPEHRLKRFTQTIYEPIRALVAKEVEQSSETN